MPTNEVFVMPLPSAPAMLTEDQVIELLALGHYKHPRRILARLTRDGRLPAVIITHGIRRYRAADVQAFTEKGNQ